MSDPAWRAFPSREALDEQLAEELATALRNAVAERGEASLVVSGGSTPIGMFRSLASRNLPWDRITVTLADERWVPADHHDSNERLVRENLLTDQAATAHFVPLLSDHERPQEAEGEVGARLQPLGTLDVVVLGMGTDGHFASLFPGSEALQRGLAPDAPACLAVDPPSAPHARLSLSLARLADTRRLLLPIVGQKKRAVLALAQSAPGSPGLPIAAALALESPSLEVFWAP